MDSRPRIFRGARFATITTLRPIKFFGRVGERDAGENLADFVAEIDISFSSLSAPDSLGGLDEADAKVNFREIVDGDSRGARGAPRGAAAEPRAPLRWPPPAQPWARSGTGILDLVFQCFDPFVASFLSTRANTVSGLPIFVPGLRKPKYQSRERYVSKSSGFPS